jgi:hypothetical protein
LTKKIERKEWNWIGVGSYRFREERIWLTHKCGRRKRATAPNSAGSLHVMKMILLWFSFSFLSLICCYVTNKTNNMVEEVQVDTQRQEIQHDRHDKAKSQVNQIDGPALSLSSLLFYICCECVVWLVVLYSLSLPFPSLQFEPCWLFTLWVGTLSPAHNFLLLLPFYEAPIL